MDRAWVQKVISVLSVARRSDLTFYDAIEARGANLPSKLYKLRGCTDFSFENLANATIHLSPASEFNDPYDTAFCADPGFLSRNSFVFGAPDNNNADDRLQQGSAPPNSLSVLVDELRDSYKICSFTERLDSILMWSHYADNHRGFAMEYDFTTCHRNDYPSLCLWPVAYTDCLLDITEVLAAAMNDKDDVNHAFTMAASLCKARDWTYEQEWRIVYPDDRTRRCMALPAPLKAVHLGARISADNASRIRDICAASGIAVHTMALSRQEYRMESHLPAG